MSFKTVSRVHFDEADPAGIAFSGLIFTKAHRCFEEFIEALDQDPQKFFLNPEVIFPIRHVEAEYFAPLQPLKSYDVEISVARLSESSFQLVTEFKAQQKVLCLTRSTHVCCDKKTLSKKAIPQDLKQSLQNFLSQQ